MSEATAVLKPKMQGESMNVGIGDVEREQIAEGLSAILVATYRLVIKTHIYHWNVVGPLFHPIHVLTEEQYGDLFEATDTIAERIRALGHHAPMMAGKGVDTGIELRASGRSAKEMVEDLISDHEEIVRQMRSAADLAEDKSDFVTHDMLTERLTFHEKALWMLRATVAD
ncbi:DNA starvation/stationary phase protection protein [Aquibium sp. A9E412]|uniref:Dps family protein n=1 Tax=Aquibium sp. A9E412 TaxID=2976767 RepID=UPI0025B1DBFC|nr:DNA starvation/stationary phase protection protein [Aquibium sp. A9E412]MDN2565403.1 DNA starvation/stationary phase protection protein [Aquibium sp. A9E412]